MRNSGLISTKTRLLILIGAAILSGFTSCSRPIETVCRHDFPRFLAEIKTAEKRVDELRDPQGRKIASGTPAALSPDERLEWKTWAERSLKNAARLMEYAEDGEFPAAEIQKIHRLSNELVIFWGNVDRGKDRVLARSLQSIGRQGLAVQGAFCYQKGND